MSSLTAGTTTAAYDINGFGQRIEKTGSSVPSGGSNEFVYDEQGNLLGEYGSTGTIIEETAYLPDTPVSVLSSGFGIAGFGAATPIAVFTGASGGTTSSLTADWLNAPHIIANSSKTYQWRWDHYDFGNNAPNQNPSGLGTFNYNFRFPGQYYDAESGVFQNGLRDAYNPSVGRYGQPDPLGLSGGPLSLYDYANGSPVRAADPRGLYVYRVHEAITNRVLTRLHLMGEFPQLGREVGGVDFLPGSQDPANAYQHAMRDGLAYPPQTVAEAQQKYNAYVNKQISSCTEEGLARALHAVQDSTAPGHRGFQPWTGHVSPQHLIGDKWAPPEDIKEAEQLSTDVILEYLATCPCPNYH